MTSPPIAVDKLHEEFDKEPWVAVDLFLGRCQLTYSIPPCTASLVTSPTGDKCFQGFDNCQDVANYDQLTELEQLLQNLFLRLTMSNGPRLKGVQAVRQVQSFTTVASGIDQKGGLGGLGKITIIVNDYADLVDLPDPYRDQRATRQGTFFRKLRSRNPFYVGRPLLMRTGNVSKDGTVDIGAGRIQRYIIEDLRPSGRGQWTIVAKDILKRMDRFRLPRPTDLALEGGIDASQTTLTLELGQGDLLITAIGLGEPTVNNPLYIRIEDEFIRVEGRAGDVLSPIVRAPAVTGTTAVLHADEAKVQAVYHNELVRIDTVIIDILNRSGIPSTLIDTVGLSAEVLRWLTNHNLRMYLSRPTATTQLLREILIAANSYMWWDAESQVVRFRHVRPRTPEETAIELDDVGHITFDPAILPQDQHDRRQTRSVIYFGTKDWSKDFRNRQVIDSVYQRARGFINLDIEGPNGYDEEKPIEIFAYMLPETLQFEMAALAFRLVSRNAKPPQRFSIGLESKDGFKLQPGNLVDITADELQDNFGNREQTECLVLRKQQERSGSNKYRFDVETTGLDDKWWFYNEDSGVPAHDLATEEQLKLAFYAKANGKLDDANGFEVEGYKYV